MLTLSYNRSGRQQLRLQCPNVDSVDGDLLMIELIQIPDYGAQTTVALWQYGEKGSFCLRSSPLAPPPPPTHTLSWVEWRGGVRKWVGVGVGVGGLIQ